jgi:hypothetical protein
VARRVARRLPERLRPEHALQDECMGDQKNKTKTVRAKTEHG